MDKHIMVMPTQDNPSEVPDEKIEVNELGRV